MRKIGMLQVWMIVFLVVGYGAASAQSDYVVTIKRDTLWGKVKYFSNSGVKYAGNSSKYVQLTPTEGKKSTHEILKTISFRLSNEVYHTVKFEEGYTFMKLLKSGYLSLYSFQMENQTTWDGRYFVKKDGSLLDVLNLGFKKRTLRFLSDCPEVVKDIDLGVLGRSDLLKIVDMYNACIDSKTYPETVKTPATAVWAKLEREVKGLPDFDKKTDATEMIRDVQNKLSKNETIPSFLISGLKDVLKDQSSVKETLDEAIGELH